MTEMFERFDNMPEFYVPNNTHLPITHDNSDEIVRGANAKHDIVIPYRYSDMVASATLFYYNKLKTILEKDSSTFEVDEHDYFSIVSVVLSPEETMLFEKGWNTFYQLKLELVDGSIVFTNKCEVKVFDTLEDKNDDE